MWISEAETDLLDFLNLTPYEGVVDWAQHAIDFSDDISAERERFDINLTPHLAEPLRAWEFHGRIREVTVIGIEQHGKTLLEVIGALWAMVHMPCSMLCVYPSDELAADINTTKYEPLMRRIPELARELERPRSRRDDRYKFSNSTMFFQGAGRKIISKSVKIRIADELSAWPNIGGIDNVEDLRKRGRSYSESIQYNTTTVRYEHDKAWQAFLAGSRGYWTLRCQHCGELTMRSCDLHNLQFESVYDETTECYILKPDTVRLVCPKCGHEHVESDKFAMNQQGSYDHKFPERMDEKPSFQFGVLCSLFPFMSWSRIAEKILSSGKRSDPEALEEFDNSWRGLPYQQRKITAQDAEGIKAHFYSEPPKAEDVEMVFLVSDTQDTFSPTGVFALDVRDNVYLLEYSNIDYLLLDPSDRERLNAERRAANLPPVTVMDDLLAREWFGLKPLIHVVDKKGHRTREIEAYARLHQNVVMYSGTQLRNDRWTMSKIARTVLVSARTFQCDLIYYLYSQRNKEGNFLFLPPDLPENTIAEITCVQPDNRRKSGHLPENWEPVGDAVHDAFDVLKMALFAVDFAIKMLKRHRFRCGKSPRICRRWNSALTDKPIKPQGKRAAREIDGTSWVRG